MHGIGISVPIPPKVILVSISTRTSIKVASKMHFTSVASDEPSLGISSQSSAVIAFQASDVNVLIYLTLVLPSTKDIMTFQLGACVVCILKTLKEEEAEKEEEKQQQQ